MKLSIFLIFLSIMLIYCSVDYSLLEERYCTSSGECSDGYVCNPVSRKCVKVGYLKDSEEVEVVDILPDILLKSDGENDSAWDTEDYYDFGVGDEWEYDVYGDIISDTQPDADDVSLKDGGCVSECAKENEIICTSDTEYKICKKTGDCLVYLEGNKCEEGQYCDSSENICKEQVCKPLEKGCDKYVAFKCNSTGSGFEYAIDCSNEKKICLEGECEDCQQNCTGRCKDEDDGCFGKCPDPCNGKGECLNGVCTCNTGYEPPYCDKCAEGYTGYPDCKKCGGDREICCDNLKCNVVNQVCTYGICRTACPAGMVRIGNSDVCIDMFEASKDGNKAASVKGSNPWGNLTKNDAQNACSASGKRLCAISEWSLACKGQNNYLYPYGNTYEPTRCVDLNAGNKCNNGDGTGVMPTGSREFCEGGYPGIFDMSGNVWEWVSDTDAGGCKLMGGSVDCCNRGNDKPACLSCDSLGTQKCDLKWPALGFRCCKDVP